MLPRIDVHPPLPDGPAALVIAHPGHELRVYGWLQATRPHVFILTDGSGRSGAPRLAGTALTLAEAGATRGPVFGRFSDAATYAEILSHNHAPFMRLVDELVDALRKEAVAYVVADACEGYNPVHDVCRFIVNAAVQILRRRYSLPILSFDFALTGRPDACPDSLRAQSVLIRLAADVFERKLTVARRSTELGIDVDEALRTVGSDAFRVELLRWVENGGPEDGLGDVVPFYERHGESRVAAGKYARVLRRREHVLPLAQAIWNHANGRWR